MVVVHRFDCRSKFLYRISIRYNINQKSYFENQYDTKYIVFNSIFNILIRRGGKREANFRGERDVKADRQTDTGRQRERKKRTKDKMTK